MKNVQTDDILAQAETKRKRIPVVHNSSNDYPITASIEKCHKILSVADIASQIVPFLSPDEYASLQALNRASYCRHIPASQQIINYSPKLYPVRYFTWPYGKFS